MCKNVTYNIIFELHKFINRVQCFGALNYYKFISEQFYGIVLYFQVIGVQNLPILQG